MVKGGWFRTGESVFSYVGWRMVVKSLYSRGRDMGWQVRASDTRRRQGMDKLIGFSTCVLWVSSYSNFDFICKMWMECESKDYQSRNYQKERGISQGQIVRKWKRFFATSIKLEKPNLLEVFWNWSSSMVKSHSDINYSYLSPHSRFPVHPFP